MMFARQAVDQNLRLGSASLGDPGARDERGTSPKAHAEAHDMETETEKRQSIRTRSKKNEAAEFHMIFAVTFVIFFFVAIFERVVPIKWLSGTPSENARRGSIIEEARAAAYTYAPYAFMG